MMSWTTLPTLPTSDIAPAAAIGDTPAPAVASEGAEGVRFAMQAGGSAPLASTAEAVVRFEAAMSKPLAENAALQAALESIVDSFDRSRPAEPAQDAPAMDASGAEIRRTVAPRTEALFAGTPSIGIEPPGIPSPEPRSHGAGSGVAAAGTGVAGQPWMSADGAAPGAFAAAPQASLSSPIVTAAWPAPDAAGAPQLPVGGAGPIAVPPSVVAAAGLADEAHPSQTTVAATGQVDAAASIVAAAKPVAAAPQTPAAVGENAGAVPSEVAAAKPVAVAPQAPVAAGEDAGAVPPEVAAAKAVAAAPQTPVAVGEKAGVVPPEVAAAKGVDVEALRSAGAELKSAVADASHEVVVPHEDADAPQEDVVAPQALPAATAAPAPAVPQVEGPGPAGSVSPAVLARVEAASAAEILVEAATSVADAMQVTPGLARGEGEVRIRLKPDVLAGTELRIVASGSDVKVEFTPVVDRVAALLVENQAGLVQRLSERIGQFAFEVRVNAVGFRAAAGVAGGGSDGKDEV